MPVISFPPSICIASPSFGFTADMLLRHFPSLGSPAKNLGAPMVFFPENFYGYDKQGSVSSLAGFAYDLIYTRNNPKKPQGVLSKLTPLVLDFRKELALDEGDMEDRNWDNIQIPFLGTDLVHVSNLFAVKGVLGDDDYFPYEEALFITISNLQAMLNDFAYTTQILSNEDLGLYHSVVGMPEITYPLRNSTLTQVMNFLLSEYKLPNEDLVQEQLTLREVGELFGVVPYKEEEKGAFWSSNYLEWFDLTTAFIGCGRATENLMEVFPESYPSLDVFDWYMNSPYIERLYRIVELFRTNPQAEHYRKEFTGEYPVITPISRYLKEVALAFAFLGNMKMMDALNSLAQG